MQLIAQSSTEESHLKCLCGNHTMAGTQRVPLFLPYGSHLTVLTVICLIGISSSALHCTETVLTLDNSVSHFRTILEEIEFVPNLEVSNVPAITSVCLQTGINKCSHVTVARE